MALVRLNMLWNGLLIQWQLQLYPCIYKTQSTDQSYHRSLNHSDHNSKPKLANKNQQSSPITQAEAIKNIAIAFFLSPEEVQAASIKIHHLRAHLLKPLLVVTDS